MLAIACSFPLTEAPQAPAADPWTRVPPLPTSCLADEFPAAVRALHETMKSEFAKQKDANDKVKEQVKVAAHTSAWVDWQDQGCLLRFTNHSLFAGRSLSVKKQWAVQLPLPFSENAHF